MAVDVLLQASHAVFHHAQVAKDEFGLHGADVAAGSTDSIGCAQRRPRRRTTHQRVLSHRAKLARNFPKESFFAAPSTARPRRDEVHRGIGGLLRLVPALEPRQPRVRQWSRPYSARPTPNIAGFHEILRDESRRAVFPRRKPIIPISIARHTLPGAMRPRDRARKLREEARRRQRDKPPAANSAYWSGHKRGHYAGYGICHQRGARIDQPPPKDNLPEIALAGRSNVGKSSLINSLLGVRPQRTSRTPGRTQLLEFFSASTPTAKTSKPFSSSICPATASPPSAKGCASWAQLIDEYLSTRKDAPRRDPDCRPPPSSQTARPAK